MTTNTTSRRRSKDGSEMSLNKGRNGKPILTSDEKTIMEFMLRTLFVSIRIAPPLRSHDAPHINFGLFGKFPYQKELFKPNVLIPIGK